MGAFSLRLHSHAVRHEIARMHDHHISLLDPGENLDLEGVAVTMLDRTKLRPTSFNQEDCPAAIMAMWQELRRL